jgi:F420H(2)-dependent quinone reductase
MPDATAPAQSAKPATIPPRWFVRTAWVVHRAMYRITGGRTGLWAPTETKWGAMRDTTTGRRTGKKRSVILGYFHDGDDLVTLAMNGWAEPHPAWWLNLQANPDAVVDTVDGTRRVHAAAATAAERDRLWKRWGEFGDDMDGYAKLRTNETAIVVLSPR